MTDSTSKPKKNETVGTRVAFLDVPQGLFVPRKRFKMLDSKELLRSLYVIRDSAVEQHTKDNLDVLINQIYKANLNV